MNLCSLLFFRGPTGIFTKAARPQDKKGRNDQPLPEGYLLGQLVVLAAGVIRRLAATFPLPASVSECPIFVECRGVEVPVSLELIWPPDYFCGPLGRVVQAARGSRPSITCFRP